MRIYVASSWRNGRQPDVVRALRDVGHDVYDFRHPEPGNDGFRWSAIDPDRKNWTVDQYRAALEHPIARRGFKLDMDALGDAHATVLVMPCGRSAHLELGIARGMKQHTAILLDGASEPELMYAACDLITASLDEIVAWMGDGR